MQPHIEQTLKDIESELACLQTLKASLLKFCNGSSVPSSPARPDRTALPAPRRKPSLGVNRVMSKSPAKTDYVDPRSIPNLRLGAKLPEPFRAVDLEHAGIKGANTMYTWMHKGWVVRRPDGKYVRTAKYPKLDGAAAPSEVVAVPAKNPDRATLQTKLDAALKQRDQALAAGRETIVELYQREVDKLSALLGQ